MVVINDIKMDIINRIISVQNLDKLIAIANHLKAIEAAEVSVKTTPKRVKKTLPLNEANTVIRKGVTFEQILEEQKHKKGLNFEDFKELQEEEWEYTLDELLNAID